MKTTGSAGSEKMSFMREAIKEAAVNLAANEGGPFGAVVVKNGKIIGRGHNQVLANNDPSAHGEVVAIRDACQKLGTYDLSGCELYTSAYPCPMCMGAIIWANIKKIYYANTASDAADIGFRDDFIYHFIEGKCSNEKVLEIEQVGREESIKVFKAFSEKADKTIY